MQYTDTQISAIKLFGRKDLTEGCKIISSHTENPIVTKSAPRYAIEDKSWDIIPWDRIITLDDEFYLIGEWYYFDKKEEYKKWKALRAPWNYECEPVYIKNFEILWHIPHLFPDVARVCREKGWALQAFLWYWNWVSDHILIMVWTTWNASISYDPTLPLLDQPSLPEIINLFKNG